MLTLWKESYDQHRQYIKKQRHYFVNNCLSSQGCGFSSSHLWMNPGRWWWTRRPVMLRFMGSQRVRYDSLTELLTMLRWGQWVKQCITELFWDYGYCDCYLFWSGKHLVWTMVIRDGKERQNRHKEFQFMCACVPSCFRHVWLYATPWTVSHRLMGFSRQEYRSGLPCPPPGYLPDSGIKPVSLMSPALAGGFFTTNATWEALL